MSQEKLKTMLMQNFGGQTRCIMGDVKVANTLLVGCFPFTMAKTLLSDLL